MQIDHTKPCKSCGAQIYAILEITVYKLRGGRGAERQCSAAARCVVRGAVRAQNAWLCIYGIIKQIK